MNKYNAKVLCHNSIVISGSRKIYIDPFKITENSNDADYIFCTHSHYDHYSEEDILKLIKSNTKLIVTEDIYNKAVELIKDKNKVLAVIPDNEYVIDDLHFKTTFAYNIEKRFHPKENNWVGYIIELDNTKYYIAGDTDNTEEIQNIECDIAFLPVGGTYTMNVQEAVNLANSINAKCIIPTHYGLIVGEKQDGELFKEGLEKINQEGKEVILEI